MVRYNHCTEFKGTVSVSSNDPPLKEGNVLRSDCTQRTPEFAAEYTWVLMSLHTHISVLIINQALPFVRGRSNEITLSVPLSGISLHRA